MHSSFGYNAPDRGCAIHSKDERLATRNLPQPQPIALEPTQAALRIGKPGLPLLLLLVVVALALIAAYSVRPVVTIDIGGRADYIYIDGFHDREFAPAKPEQRYDWPVGVDRLTIYDVNRTAAGMATFTLDAFTPDASFPRRLIAVYANEQQLTTFSDRGGKREFAVLLPTDLDLSNGLVLRLEPIPDKTLDIPRLQTQQVMLSAARTYRWSDGAATIRLPALGRGQWQIELQTVVIHPDQSPVNARLLANGSEIARLPEYNDSRQLSFIVPETVVGDGDLVLSILSDTYRDPRPLGTLIERVVVTPAGSQNSLPPLSAFLPAFAIALSAYGALRWLAVPRWWACAAAASAILLGAWALAEYRMPMGYYLPPLALLVLLSALFVLPLERLIDWGFRRLDIPLDPTTRRLLILIFLIGFWLKAGGMVFPYMRSIDIQWHMERVRWILDGQLAAMYQPGAFSESVMPIDEWGPNRPVIPYSPFFHIFSTVFALIPWWPMELSANLFSALLDTSRGFLIMILGLKAGLSKRASLLAVLLMASTPFTFLLHSWGNVPTTFGIWWTLVATTVIVALYPKLHKPGPLALLTFVTLACMLFYTVMAVFYVFFLIAFLGILRIRPAAVDKRPIRAIIIASAIGFALSVLIYYGQYIPSMIERTLPYMLNLTARGSESVGVQREPFAIYVSRYIPHLDYHIWPGDFLYYGIAIPAIFAIPGFLVFRKQPLIWAMLAGWYTIAVFFFFAGYRISMVDKQIFYIWPAICLCWAIYAEGYWQRGRWPRLFISVFYLFTLVSALDLWVIRIIRSPIE
jgi:hypothetical protein